MSDFSIRLAAFHWLTKQVERHGDVLPWALLSLGFTFREQRIPLVSQQGIFRPRIMELPISIRTSANGPYDDNFGPDGLLRYRYRGTNPDHVDNVGLRRAMEQQSPLAYFHGIVPGQYLAIWPVYIVGDDARGLCFSVAVDDAAVALSVRPEEIAEDSAPRRRYVTALARRRLHQKKFSEQVLRAYRYQCALCRLRYKDLLDAAHIVPDREEGPPEVRNGLALCKLHHAAFDAFFLAIRPADYRVEVRSDILDEHDGPMLVHGLQQLDGGRIVLPRRSSSRPDPELLAEHYERFAAATP